MGVECKRQMPLNHPYVADLDDGATSARVDGPGVLAAISDAFDRDPSIVCAPPRCLAAARGRANVSRAGVCAYANATRAGIT